jgi:hypothetical protein
LTIGSPSGDACSPSSCIDEARALCSRRIVLSRRSSLRRPAPTASRPPSHFPGSPVIGGHRFPPPAAAGPRRSPQFPGRPSTRSAPTTPEGQSAPAPGPETFFMAFAVCESARHPLRRVDDACSGFAHAADRTVASAHASHPASLLRTEALLPGTRASARTGLSPAGRPELVARSGYVRLLSLMAPEPLGALAQTQPGREEPISARVNNPGNVGVVHDALVLRGARSLRPLCESR